MLDSAARCRRREWNKETVLSQLIGDTGIARKFCRCTLGEENMGFNEFVASLGRPGVSGLNFERN